MKTEVVIPMMGSVNKDEHNDYVISIMINALMSALRRMVVMLALTALVTPSVMFLASPASAQTGWDECYNRGEYSFKHRTSNPEHSTIEVYRGSGCFFGRSILEGEAKYDGKGSVILKVIDKKCDNTGLTLRTWGRRGKQIVVTNPGCPENINGKKGVEERSVPVKKLGGPRNFWVHVRGTTNSNAVPLPLP